MEPKFRSWNVEEKIMHDIAIPSWNGMHEVWQDNKPQTKIQYLSNGPEEEGILMQFTGLKDKNGKEIFEGDIMQDCDVPKLFNWKVEFLDGGFKGVNIGVDGYLGQRYPLTQAMTMQREVIGNIHQNPELLCKTEKTRR